MNHFELTVPNLYNSPHSFLATLLSQCETPGSLTAAVWCSLRRNWDYAIKHRCIVMSSDIFLRPFFQILQTTVSGGFNTG